MMTITTRTARDLHALANALAEAEQLATLIIEDDNETVQMLIKPVRKSILAADNKLHSSFNIP